MTPNAKIAVLTFALQQIRDGHNWPKQFADAAVRFVEDPHIEITGAPSDAALEQMVRRAVGSREREAELVAAAEQRAAALKGKRLP